MIGAIMSKPEHTSDERFMLRFGIVDYETNFYDRDQRESRMKTTLASVPSEDSFFEDK